MPEHDTIPKCADCGFLTLRNLLTGNLDDMDREFRITGNPPHRRAPVVDSKFAVGDLVPYRHVPICLAQSVDLAAEWKASDELLDWDEELPALAMLDIVSKERPECADKFTPWQQGFTPKEHREMLDRDRALDWQRDREEDDRKWREDQRTVDNNRHTKELAVIVGGIIVASVIALAAAFIDRGGSDAPDVTNEIIVVVPSPAVDALLTPTPFLEPTLDSEEVAPTP